MSSSEEDSIPLPIKRIKRRKYLCLDNNPMKEVDIFSRKVMPALFNNQRSALQQLKVEEESNLKVLSEPTLDYLPTSAKSCQSDEDDVKIIGEDSPVKPLSVTPPPERRLGFYSNDKILEKKKKKLLDNIASVLAKTKPDNLSFSYTPEKTDRDVADDSIIVKVRFQSTIHKYAMKKEAQFHSVFERLAENGKTKIESLLLTLYDRRIYPEDTPELIELTVVDFIGFTIPPAAFHWFCSLGFRLDHMPIEMLVPKACFWVRKLGFYSDAVIMDEQLLHQAKHDDSNKQNFIKVHFQSKFFKQKQTYSVNMFKPFAEPMNSYAKSIGSDLRGLCFLFDGEVIDGTLTAIELEIEDDYCIDVVQLNKK